MIIKELSCICTTFEAEKSLFWYFGLRGGRRAVKKGLCAGEDARTTAGGDAGVTKGGFPGLHTIQPASHPNDEDLSLGTPGEDAGGTGTLAGEGWAVEWRANSALSLVRKFAR